jgi:hypothetical protein
MREAQKLLAVSLQHVHMDSKEVLGEVGKTISQMLEMMKKMQQENQKLDPNVKVQVDALTQTQMAETQRKAAKDQADMQYKMQDMQIMNQEKQDQIVADQQIKAAEITHDINTMTLERQFAAQEQQEQHDRQMQMQMQQQQAAQQQAQAAQQPSPQQQAPQPPPPQPPQGAGNV